MVQFGRNPTIALRCYSIPKILLGGTFLGCTKLCSWRKATIFFSLKITF